MKSLRSIDLNLLVVLNALIEEGSVRRAGHRLGLSQSATSHALARLRTLLGDELLVRTARGMEPTPRALRLSGRLRLALEDIEATLAPEAFDPSEARRSFHISVETYETIVILSGIVEQVSREAPGIDIAIQSGSNDLIVEDIDKGRADIAIGTFEGLPERFMTRQLFRDRHVCVMRADHPLAQQPLTLEAFLQTPHVLISQSGKMEDIVDDALAQQGLQRRIAFRLPNGLAAVVALTQSDMIAVVSFGAAQMFRSVAPLIIVDLPLSLPRTTFRLIWNRRLNDNPAHAWLRRKLVTIGEAAMGKV